MISKDIEFDLMKISTVTKAIKKLERLTNDINSRVNREFVKLSLQWLMNYAMEEIRLNFPYSEPKEIKAELLDSFVIEISADGSSGKLINTSSQAVYIEFGIGVVGEGTHASASELGYRYNVPSPAKDYAKQKGFDNSWYFNGHITQGNKAVEFMERAIINYLDTKVYVKLFEQAFERYWRD